MMKKTLLGVTAMLALSVGARARADELADANSALAQKNYSQAQALYGKLAAAGNAEATLHLGEMAWYGEGVALDRAKGDALFAQAAKLGSKEARAALSLSAQRDARSADIAYWLQRYDGAELRAGRFDCATPAIPDKARSKAEIRRTLHAVNAYVDCHNAFLANLESVAAAGKAIPPEVMSLMSEQELRTATAHLASVYAAVLAKGQAEADQVLAQQGAWKEATVQYVAKANANVAERNLAAWNEIDPGQLYKSAGYYAGPRPTVK
jgi:TPR repeat protein